MYRKPDGTPTADTQEYIESWKNLAGPIEEATGWRLTSFDPLLSFVDTSTKHWWGCVQITVAFAQALSKALRRGQ